ncbi:MAG TPA: endonuclease/exonuclease/phosphatase family protein [Candidatus Nitrosocosmicus sp.]|nr:endonuclease/exonuclease/phosphatase family protein [Candidatus Nitrosocosmicus sp.]
MYSEQTLKMISLNIEGNKHIDNVKKLLIKESPDVICLQEVFEKDIATINKDLNYFTYYFAMTNYNSVNQYNIEPRGIWGILILCKSIPIMKQSFYYVGTPDIIPPFEDGNPNSSNRVLGVIRVKKNNDEFTLATTHFTWTPNGDANDQQREDLKSLFTKLDQVGECILCGDFNAPRGGEIFSMIAEKFTDNIPTHITTTIDSKFHYAGNLQLVVDGIFSTKSYAVKDVRIIDGISDHKAIIANIISNNV